MNRPLVILVGGFLGAGKTTLLAEAGRRLQGKGKRVSYITNDQASNLVDTHTLATVSPMIAEVDGGHFGCKFDTLAAGLNDVIATGDADVVLAEPVGSCTDLSATVIQPLKKYLSADVRLAPLSVLADPMRLKDLYGLSRLPESVKYIMRTQLEEADVIILTKADCISAIELYEYYTLLERDYPGRPIFPISALRGAGVDQWLTYASSGVKPGEHLVDVDYDLYAEGEATLGWLNTSAHLTARDAEDWAGYTRRVLNGLKEACRASRAEIAHVKLMVKTGKGKVLGNLTSIDSEPSVQESSPGVVADASLVLNARVEISPDQLQSIVRESLANAAGSEIVTDIDELSSLTPERPHPTYRFSEVV